jgi:hypothetical protein
MANCLYCGKPAGFLRKQHRECEARFEEGLSRLCSITMDSILGEMPIESLEERLNEIAESSYIPTSRIKEALIRGWERAVDHFLEDGCLDESEEKRLNLFRQQFILSRIQLDNNGAYSRFQKGLIIRDVVRGIVPEGVLRQSGMPFNLQKNEKLVYTFNNVEYYEYRKRRQYVGGYQGVSIRIARGLYYRVGGFKGNPIETTETIFIGSGILALTNRHLYFTGGGKNFRIRHEKIVSIEPYSDGVRIQRDAQTATPQAFITGDGWFTYNLLINAANL